jgi:hypothetical protein
MTAPNLAPQNANGESVERTPLFRSRQDLIVKVYNAGDDDEPFICAVNGEVTVDALAEIEEELKGEHEFSSGPGEYTYGAAYDDGQYDEMGRCELAPYWELTEIAFEKPDWMSLSHDPEKAEKRPCMSCGRIDCGTDDDFERCIPF